MNGVFANRPPGTEVFSPLSGNFFRQFNFNRRWNVRLESRIARPVYPSYPALRRIGLFTTKTTSMRPFPVIQSVIENRLKWHFDRALVSAPQERYSFFASGKYDFTDRARFFARATMAESETETVLFGTNAIFGWEGTVQFNPTTDSPLNPALNYQDTAVVAAAVANPSAYANPSFIPTGAPGAQHPVPAELAALLLGRLDSPFTPTNDTLADWMPGWNPDHSLLPRGTLNTNTVWQIEGGFEFDMLQEWTGELYLSHGQSSTYNNAGGNLSLSRYRDMIRRPDYGRNAVISGNSTGQSPGFGAADVTCTSGFYDTYFRGDMPLSEDCFNAINATLQTRAQNVQDIIELNFQGPLFNLPAGEVRMAAGYQGRENSAKFVPDILQSTVSFTDQVIGVYPTGYMDAETSVDDLYVEFLIPLIADKTAFQALELEIGARTSDYEHTDKEDTYKFLINWEVNDWVRFRGGFNRATRAPNIGELFLNVQEIFQIGGNNFGDPCGLRSTSPYGAGGTGPDPELTPGETQPQLASGQTPQGAQSTRLICEAMMGPTAANQFYNVANAPAAGGGAFNWVNQRGNSSLTSETADSITFGFVMNSPFDSPWLANTTLSLDYYKVEIEDAIMLYSVDYANFRCFGAQSVVEHGGSSGSRRVDGVSVGPEKPGARRTAHHVDLVRQSGHD